MIDAHFRALRAHPRYGRCHIRVFIEANMSFYDSKRVRNQLMHPIYGSIEVVTFDSQKGVDRFGIWTTKDSKENYRMELRRAMVNMVVADHFISLAKLVNLAEMYTQIGHFRTEIIAPANETGAELFYKVAITGKSSGRKDDCVMALCIALFYMYRSVDDEVFLQRCQQKGLSHC